MKKLTPPDFLITPYQLVQDPNIKPLDERVYGVIYWLTKLKGEKCVASNNTLAEICLTTPHSIQNSLSRLEENGYIQRVFKDNSKRVRYEIVPLVVFAKVSLTDDTISPTDDTYVSPTDDQNNKNNKKEKINNNIAKQASPKKSVKNQRVDEPETGLNQRVDETDTNALSDNSKTATPSVAVRKDQDIFDLTNLFKEVNPSYEKLFKNKTQRSAMERLIKKLGREKLEKVIKVLPITNSKRYAPIITTPVQLEDKLGQLIAFTQKQRSPESKIKAADLR